MADLELSLSRIDDEVVRDNFRRILEHVNQPRTQNIFDTSEVKLFKRVYKEVKRNSFIVIDVGREFNLGPDFNGDEFSIIRLDNAANTDDAVYTLSLETGRGSAKVNIITRELFPQLNIEFLAGRFR